MIFMNLKRDSVISRMGWLNEKLVFGMEDIRDGKGPYNMAV